MIACNISLFYPSAIYIPELKQRGQMLQICKKMVFCYFSTLKTELQNQESLTPTKTFVIRL